MSSLNFSKNWCLFLLWGIALTVLGIFAIGAATFTTMLTVIFLGVLILLSGIVILVDAFTFWRRKWSSFLAHLLLGALYATVGLMLIAHRLKVHLVNFITRCFYVVIGVFRMGYSLAMRLLPRWKWIFFNGIISLLLGFLILANWPQSSLVIIGLFVGIDLLFCGIAYVMMGLAARSMTNSIS